MSAPQWGYEPGNDDVASAFRGRAGRVAALLCAVFLGLAGLFTGGGNAYAQPTAAQLGQGALEFIEANLSVLCPSDAPGSGESADTPPDQADPGTGGPIGGAAECAQDALREAFADCVDPSELAGALTEFESNESEIFECLAGKGFGEEEEEEEEETTEEEAVANLSLARLSANLTSFYANSLSPLNRVEADEEEEASENDGGIAGVVGAAAEPAEGLDAWASVLTVPGSAGSFVGSMDPAMQGNTDWLFGPSSAANMSEVNYSAFDRRGNISATAETVINSLGESGGLAGGYSDIREDVVGMFGGAPDSGVEKYLLYGALLNSMGFDNMIEADGADAATRNIHGLTIMAGYMGSGAVDMIFDAALSVLQWTNPFKFMVDAVSENTNPTFTEGMEGNSDDEIGGNLDGLREFFSTIYNAMVNLGWMIVIPIFITMFCLGLLVMQRFDKGSKTKELIVRIGFMVVGVPLLGVTYTAGLEAMEGASGESASSHATKVVLSTYVDFEAWVNGPRLRPPDHAEGQPWMWWDLENGEPNGSTTALGRQFALKINADTRNVWRNLAEDIDGNTDDTAWATSVADGEPPEDDSSGRVFTATMELINRYRSGDTVNAGAFESSIKAGLQNLMDSNDAAAPHVLEWFQGVATPEALTSMNADDVAEMRNPLIEVSSGASLTASPDDGGRQVMAFGRGKESSNNCNNSTVVATGWSSGISEDTVDGEGPDPRTSCNLSPMAMFNYLNTSFGPTSMDVYAPDVTTSGWAREFHSSVSSVGRGMAVPVYWFSAMVMLAAFTIIGLIYALAMVVSSLKRAIQLIGSVPFAAIGFMAGIAKTIIYTAALFLELLGTIFMYKVVQELIMVLPSMIERPLVERLNGDITVEGATGLGLFSAGVLTIAGEGNMGTVVIIVTLVVAIVLLVFLIMAIKLRRALLDGIDHAVTRLVNKFTESQVSPGLDPGQPGAMRQGLARGGGMAATSMIMSGGLSGGDADVDGQVDGNDPGANPGTAPAPGTGPGGGPGDDGDDGSDGGAGSNSGDPGAPGTHGDGSMTVDQDGQMKDAAGNPITNPRTRTPLTAGDLMPVDASGNISDSYGGQPIMGENGSPLQAANVAGFDSEGRLLDDEGNTILNEKGEAVRSQTAAQVSSSLAGDRALAEQTRANGLTQFDNSASGDGGGGGSALGTAAALTASSMVTQRMANGPQRKAPEVMGGSGGGSGGGRGGGKGAPAPKPPPRRSAGGAGAQMGVMAGMSALQGGDGGSGPPPPPPPPGPPQRKGE